MTAKANGNGAGGTWPTHTYVHLKLCRYTSSTHNEISFS